MVSYLALAYLKGDSAKAMKICVCPDPFTPLADDLIFIPFETKSK